MSILTLTGWIRPGGTRSVFAQMSDNTLLPASLWLMKHPEDQAAVELVLSRATPEAVKAERERIKTSIANRGADTTGLLDWLKVYWPQLIAITFPLSLPYVAIMEGPHWVTECASLAARETAKNVVEAAGKILDAALSGARAGWEALPKPTKIAIPLIILAIIGIVGWKITR